MVAGMDEILNAGLEADHPTGWTWTSSGAGESDDPTLEAGQVIGGNTTEEGILSPCERRQRGDLYYTRSHKLNGRVVRECVGMGLLAELAVELA